MKRFLKLFACVLALSLLVAFAINASKVAKPLVGKKVPNPDNLISIDNLPDKYKKVTDVNNGAGVWYTVRDDGSIELCGTAQKDDYYDFIKGMTLEAGKTYTFSSGSRNTSNTGYGIQIINRSTGQYVCWSDFSTRTFTVSNSSHKFDFEIYVKKGTDVKDVFYPVLVEGTEPGDFYIYK